MSLPLELLTLAQFLAQDGVKPGYPCKQAALRRAISTAYYSLFHHVVERGVGRLNIGKEPLQRVMRASAARWPDHAKVKKLCEAFSGGRHAAALPKGCDTGGFPTPSGALVRAARAFVALQDLRHRADYDLSARVTPQDARRACEQASDGIGCFDQALLKVPDPWASWFFLLLMSERRS